MNLVNDVLLRGTKVGGSIAESFRASCSHKKRLNWSDAPVHACRTVSDRLCRECSVSRFLLDDAFFFSRLLSTTVNSERPTPCGTCACNLSSELLLMSCLVAETRTHFVLQIRMYC
jgi:hypothetical protein